MFCIHSLGFFCILGLGLSRDWCPAYTALVCSLYTPLALVCRDANIYGFGVLYARPVLYTRPWFVTAYKE